MSALLSLIAALGLGYAFGSVPFGLLLTRLAGTQDIRTVGSGNIGATNVLRTGRRDLAAATLICDALKGTCAVLLAGRLLGPDAALIAAVGAFLGHVFPLWLQFHGGKGVATYLGCLLGLSWPTSLAFAGVWLLVAFVSRISSAAALIASAITPVILLALQETRMALVFVALTLALFLTHRDNLARLVAGSESRIGQK